MKTMVIETILSDIDPDYSMIEADLGSDKARDCGGRVALASYLGMPELELGLNLQTRFDFFNGARFWLSSEEVVHTQRTARRAGHHSR